MMPSTKYLRTSLLGLRNLVIGGNVRAFGLLSKPRDMVYYASETLFLYKTLAEKRKLPQKNIWEVLPSKNATPLVLAGFAEDSWFGPVASYTADIVSLCLLCRRLQPKTIFEVGTLRGYTTYHLALNSPADARIYTLDLPPHQINTKLQTTLVDDWHIEASHRDRKYIFDGTPEASKVTTLFHDSASFDFSPYYGEIDLFFIDGAHSYEYVRSDSLNAIKCCRKGSVIAWHDFGRTGVNGVSRWLVEFSKEHKIYTIPGGSLAFMVV
jgi:hypothetical protein